MNVHASKQAITFGRYNICTLAHLHTIEQIASKFDQIVIGVIDDKVDASRVAINKPLVHQFYELADQQNERTVFDLKERIAMVKLSIRDKGLQDRIKVVPLKRPEYDTSYFSRRYSADKYQLVFPKPVKKQAGDSFEEIRDRALPIILNRKIVFIPTYFTLHASLITSMSAHKPDIWQQYMSPSSYKYFVKISGPERALAKSHAILV